MPPLTMLLALLRRAPWRTAAPLIVLVGLLGFQQLQVAALRRSNAALAQRLERAGPDVAPAAELEELKDGLGAIRRDFATFTEQLSLLGTTLTRVVRAQPAPGAQGPAGPPGAPGMPGRDGEGASGPLIPAADQPRARERAAARLVAHLMPGRLVGCDTPSLGIPNALEFLQDTEGRWLSTAPCVWGMDYQVTVRPEAPAIAAEPSRWKLAAGYDLADRTAGYGVAYEWLRLPLLPLTVDAVAIGTPSAHVGAGVSWVLSPSLTIGGAYLWDLAASRAEPWAVLAWRW